MTEVTSVRRPFIKLQAQADMFFLVLHPCKYDRFSNTISAADARKQVLHPCKYDRFSNCIIDATPDTWFYTLVNMTSSS